MREATTSSCSEWNMTLMGICISMTGYSPRYASNAGDPLPSAVHVLAVQVCHLHSICGFVNISWSGQEGLASKNICYVHPATCVWSLEPRVECGRRDSPKLFSDLHTWTIITHAPIFKHTVKNKSLGSARDRLHFPFKFQIMQMPPEPAPAEGKSTTQQEEGKEKQDLSVLEKMRRLRTSWST